MPPFAEKIAAVKQDRQKLLDKASLIKEMADDQEEGLTDAQLAKIDEHVAKAEELGAEIKSLEDKAKRLGRLDDLQSELDAVPASRTRQAGAVETPDVNVDAVRERWLDDPKKGFRSERDYFQEVIKASQEPGSEIKGALAYLATDAKGVPLHMAAGSDEQSTFSDPHGGFLVPEGFSPNLLTVDAEPDPMAGRTMNIPMGNPVVSIPARVDKDHSNSVTGGLRVYRRAEADQAASSRMEVEQIKLEANGLQGVAYITEELLRDSPISVAALIQNNFRTEFSSKLIDERLNGTGVGEFMGVNSSPALISVDKTTGQAADTILYDNIVNMRARVWGYQMAVWLYNHDALPQLMKLKDENNTLIWQPSARDGEPDRLLGRPAFASEYMETVGDAGDILCANWSQYLEGTYQPLETAESIHVRFLQHERTFRFFMRNAGQPWWRTALTPKNSTDTLSPFVRLAARA